MRCNCGGETIVLNVRERLDITGLPYVARRRECKECGTRFSTYEADMDVMQKLFKLRKMLLEHEVI